MNSLHRALTGFVLLTALGNAWSQVQTNPLNRNPERRENLDLSPRPVDPRDSTSRPVEPPNQVMASDGRDAVTQPQERSDVTAPPGAAASSPSYALPAPTPQSRSVPSAIPGRLATP